MDPLVSPDGLRDLLREVFGSGVEVVTSTVLNQRDEYLVLRVEIRRPTQSVIVKLAGPGAPYPCPFDRTAAVQALARRQTTVPLAEIVAVDTSYQRWPWRYLIAEAVPGNEWASVRQSLDARAVAAAQREIGDAVGQLHTIGLAQFGEIDVQIDTGSSAVASARPGNCGCGPSWTEALAGRARQQIGDAGLRDSFLSILADRADLLADVAGPALTHDDLHQRNILLRPTHDGWRLAAILDFDKAWAADPSSDLARLELWRGMTGPEFWSAYRAHCPAGDGYAEWRPLYQLLWCLEYARATKEHVEDTRAVCAALGLSAILIDTIIGQFG